MSEERRSRVVIDGVEHRPQAKGHVWRNAEGNYNCRECGYDWPCPAARTKVLKRAVANMHQRKRVWQVAWSARAGELEEIDRLRVRVKELEGCGYMERWSAGHSINNTVDAFVDAAREHDSLKAGLAAAEQRALRAECQVADLVVALRAALPYVAYTAAQAATVPGNGGSVRAAALATAALSGTSDHESVEIASYDNTLPLEQRTRQAIINQARSWDRQLEVATERLAREVDRANAAAEVVEAAREHITLCGGGEQDMERTGMLAASRKRLHAAVAAMEKAREGTDEA